jgi:hypothetical protein
VAKQRFNSPGARKPSLVSFAAVANTGTESCLWNNSVTTALQIPYAQIPAYDMNPGDQYKVSFGGVLSTTATGPTVVWTPRHGANGTAASNVTLGASTAVTLAANLAAIPFWGEFTLNVRSLALSGNGATATGNGYVMGGAGSLSAANTNNGSGFFSVMGGTIATTLDDSATTGLLVDLTWGTANAGNTATCQWVKFEDN